MPEEPSRWVWLARIRRPQGRKGEVFAEILTDFPEKFQERRHLWLLAGNAASRTVGAPESALSMSKGLDLETRDGRDPTPPAREVELANHWLHKGGIVLHFAGVDSISAAELLAGMIVAIPLAERAALQDDETYIGDLIGCLLLDVGGVSPVEVGAIDDVDRSAGPVPLLVVHGAKGEVLVPFAGSYLRKIDLVARRVEMELPEGLIELNSA
jgi:16S rRNA processing protein RimM